MTLMCLMKSVNKLSVIDKFGSDHPNRKYRQCSMVTYTIATLRDAQ